MEIKLINERDPEISFMDQVLKNRGVEQDTEEFLNLTWDCVNNPYNLDYMEEATNLLIDHIAANSRIAILVDVDMDGFSSSAILTNYIHAQIQYGEWGDYTEEIIPVFHEGKIHGLADTEMMRRVRDNIQPKLFIIPDASGNEAQYKALTDLGIDILVLDHHDMIERGDGEKVVVVNNQQSKNYTNKDFSGAGIVWQFCRALDDKLEFACADSYLDLVAIGNIGDVMDLRSPETRFICNLGLEDHNILSEFLGYLKFSEYSLRNKSFNPHTVGFNVAPLFNAVCRIGSMAEKKYLFNCLIEKENTKLVPNGKRGHENEFVTLVSEGVRLASNARGRQNTRKDKLVSMIDNIISEEDLYDQPVLVLCFDDYKEDYRPLTGLVASGIADIYDRPAIVAFKDKDGNYTGSLRSPSNDKRYENFKDQCEESGCCLWVAGHQYAAGICIKKDCQNRLEQYFVERYADMDTEITEKVDFVFDFEDADIIDCINELAPYENVWGQNLDAPKIAIKNVKLSILNMDLVGGKKNTMRIHLPCGVTLINFKSSQAEFDSLKLPYNGVEQYYTATIICKNPSVNEFAGVCTPQLEFTDMEVGDIHFEF